jgi:hypothetical protein
MPDAIASLPVEDYAAVYVFRDPTTAQDAAVTR